MPERFTNSISLVSGLVLATLLISGCNRGDGVELGEVTGLVTLDGQPLANASVSFYPSNGRASFGKTNAEGKYELIYIRDKGAIIGDHKVTITSKVWGEASRKAGPGQRPRDVEAAASEGAREEMLPEKYTIKTKTVLSAQVSPGTNEHNFELKSE